MDILNLNLIHAIGWTLLHSLWQSGAFAILAVAIISLFKIKNSNTRYWISVFTMLCVILTTIITFHELNNYGGLDNQISPRYHNENSSLVSKENQIDKTLTKLSFVRNAEVFFTKNMSLIVYVWLLGIILLTLKLMSNYIFMQRLKGDSKIPVSNKWIDKLEQLSQKVGISRIVKLYESSLVQVPSVIGVLKPLIFLPISTLSNLSIKQVEMILLHELAHIKRYDYLFNMIQTTFDILFFFNPAFRWISQQIRTERELVCDDIAVAVSKDALNYAKTLTLLEEMKMKTYFLKTSVAFNGNNKSFSNRIKRLFNQEEKYHLRFTNFLISILFFLISSGTIFSQSMEDFHLFSSDSSLDSSRVTELSKWAKGLDSFEMAIAVGMLEKKLSLEYDQMMASDTIVYDYKEQGFLFDTKVVAKIVDEKVVHITLDGEEIRQEDFDIYAKKSIKSWRDYQQYRLEHKEYTDKLKRHRSALAALKIEIKKDNFYIVTDEQDGKSHCSIKLDNGELFINNVKKEHTFFLKYKSLLDTTYESEKYKSFLIFE